MLDDGVCAEWGRSDPPQGAAASIRNRTRLLPRSLLPLLQRQGGHHLSTSVALHGARAAPEGQSGCRGKTLGRWEWHTALVTLLKTPRDPHAGNQVVPGAECPEEVGAGSGERQGKNSPGKGCPAPDPGRGAAVRTGPGSGARRTAAGTSRPGRLGGSFVEAEARGWGAGFHESGRAVVSRAQTARPRL